ncbi:Phosphatidyl-N-methylethanolamine N-methyltransferase [Ascosphaera acerosa]|nr:Phosphatidyl-N-methylethanolamine N-methyltransferase [Ascosphaera acerosa]
MPALSAYIDPSRPSFQPFNPVFWNIVARGEHHTRFLTRLFGGARNGCYALAAVIFALGLARDQLYDAALAEQPFFAPLHQPLLAAPLFAAGATLVLSSMYALGVTGTYLGDYFGILMDAPVTAFPFSVSGAPMYWGSTLNFLAVALWRGSAAGLLLSAEVYVAYWLALKWEE